MTIKSTRAQIKWTHAAFLAIIWLAAATPLTGQQSTIDQTGESQQATPLNSSGLATGDLAANEIRQQQITTLLLAELDSLIPGDLEEGSPLTEGLGQAVEAFQTGDSARATEILKQQIQSHPELPPLELLQAGLTYGVGNSAAGLPLLEAAARKHPEYPGIYFAFARLAISQRRITDAIALLEKAERTLQQQLSKDESQHFETMLYETKIDLGMLEGQFDEVAGHIEKLTSINPDNRRIKLAQAELAFQLQQYDKSFEQLQAYHQLNSNSQLPELVMAGWFQQLGKTEDTGKWIGRAAQAYPDNSNVQLAFATYAVSQGNFREAQQSVKKIEDVAGEVAATQLLKAKIAFASEAYGLAATHYEKIAQAQPNSFDVTNMYALALIESDSEEKRNLALAIGQRNYRQYPDNPVAQAAFGWMLLKSGDRERAQALLSRAARSPQLAPEISYFLADMLHQTGRSQQAKLVLEPAMESEGLFLYRAPAQRLLDQINAADQSSLPEPRG